MKENLVNFQQANQENLIRCYFVYGYSLEAKFMALFSYERPSIFMCNSPPMLGFWFCRQLPYVHGKQIFATKLFEQNGYGL